MKILFFDTETTGLPKDYRAPVTDVDNWPRLVQLAWIQLDTETGKQSEHNYIIKPDGFEIPKAASDVHGITTEIATQKGYKLRDVIRVFALRVLDCDFFVGHNVGFDRKIVGAELIRCGIEDVLHGKPRVCTMFSTTKFCNLPGKRGPKWPTLQELHKKLFGFEFDGAHDALADVIACKNCFVELLKRGVIEI